MNPQKARYTPLLSTVGLLASFGCSGDGSFTPPGLETGSDGNAPVGPESSGGGALAGTGGDDALARGAPTGGGVGGTGGLLTTGGALGTAGIDTSAGGANTGLAGAEPVMVDCSAIADHENWELCESGGTYCAAVFTDGAGCGAVCAAAGLECAEVWENEEEACAADVALGLLPCEPASGHQSDYCVCVGDSETGNGGAGGTGGTNTATGGTDAGIGGMDAGIGGDGNASVCEAMGWATRDGRSGGEVAVTGGGTAAPVTVTSFSELQDLAGDDAPRVIFISGTVGGGWSGTSGDRLRVGSNKTIAGLAPGTELRAPISISDSRNVIIRNLVIRGPGSNSEQAWDNINIQGSSKNIWIDHCEFWDGQDGNADVVKGADNVTFSWNIFGYTTNGGHNFSNLVASSDSEPQSVGKLNITFMFNWFTGVAQRAPRCRFGDIHLVNNLYTAVSGLPSDYGTSAGVDCRILTEANHFIGIKNPIQDSHSNGNSVNELKGNNIFENTSGKQSGFGGAAFIPPYQYDHLLVASSQVQDLVEARAGATLTSPDDCD